VTTSPIQTRGQFSSSNFAAQSRQANVNNHNNFGLAQNYNFPSSAQQRQNPYLDSTGFGEVKILIHPIIALHSAAQFTLIRLQTPIGTIILCQSKPKPHNALIIFSAIQLSLNYIERYEQNSRRRLFHANFPHLYLTGLMLRCAT